MTCAERNAWPDMPRRRPRHGDDTGSIPMLMMAIIVGLALSALLVPMIITQDRTTRFDTTRVQALGAAQAGIVVAIGNIRAAVTSGIGSIAVLPCGVISPTIASPTTNTLDPATYSVRIEYFTFDPVNVPKTTTLNMPCAVGYLSGAVAPSYARLTSTGTVGTAVNGSTGGRTLVSTYVFQTANVAGGAIQLAATGLCMDAGSVNPNILLQTCASAAPQNFAYRDDLTLQALPSGLCLTPNTTSPLNITLSACLAVTDPLFYTQQWSFTNQGAFEAAQSTSRNDGTLGLCMTVATATSGVTLSACRTPTGSYPLQNWRPATSVGAGAAGLPSSTINGRNLSQLVNYSEFSRCVKVTAVTANHLSDIPCTQNPWAGAVQSNESFSAPVIPTGQTSVAGPIYTTTPDGSTTYCLTSPGPGIAPRYVTVANNGGTVTATSPCGTSTASQNWTMYSGDRSLPYSMRNTIRDSSSPSLCLGLEVPFATETWLSIVVEPCTGATEQKWNALPTVSVPVLQNTSES